MLAKLPPGDKTGLALVVKRGLPSDLTFDQLWGDFEDPGPAYADSVSTAVLRINMMRNLIAKRTRRSFGNMLFTADADLIEVLKTQRSLEGMTYIHVPELQPGEARMAFFSDRHKLLDAGVALYDSQLYAHPGYAAYFARMVL